MFALCADTEAEARRLAQSRDLFIVRLYTGRMGPYPSVEEAEAYPYNPHEQAIVRSVRGRSVVGTPEQVQRAPERPGRQYAADELVVVGITHDPKARLRSYDSLPERSSWSGARRPRHDREERARPAHVDARHDAARRPAQDCSHHGLGCRRASAPRLGAADKAGQPASAVVDQVKASGLGVACVGVELGWIWASGEERARLFRVFDEQWASGLSRVRADDEPGRPRAR